ncbi:MAG TPA: hypothetical protein VIN70_10095 [Candidatus Limnocylindria bacterium]|jgi:hypothetical protein
MKDILNLVRTLIWLAFFGAIYQELKKPAEERTWHGKVAGVVPYDFRIPDLQRLKEAYWAPESDVVFTEKVLGVGWSVNLPVATRKLSEIASQYAGAIRSRTEG